MKSETSAHVFSNKESGNAVIIVLVALVVVAVGALGYLSTRADKAGASDTTKSASAEPASGQASAQAELPPLEIKPGNPVVAKVKGQEIKRLDVVTFMQTLPENVRQLPLQQVFPLAVNQIINQRLIEDKVSAVNLDNDPAVKQQLEVAKTNIVRNVFMQKETEKALTDERLKAAYDQYVANFPQIDEVKSRHILVQEEAVAKDVLKKLKEGGDFAALAKEHSIDSTKDNGGELGYIAKGDQVLPEFLEALFSTSEKKLLDAPVKTDAGYHVIETLEMRQRPPATFEQAKAFLSGQLRNVVLGEIMTGWRQDAKVEMFDINGEPLQAVAPEKTSASDPALDAKEPANKDG